MRTQLVLQLAVLLSIATNCIASTIDYQHADLTIVADQKPLESVLKSVGREMGIFVTIPSSLNPMVICDIQHQASKQALKNLLGDLAFSLVWAQDRERLIGLTVLAAGDEAAVTAVSDSAAHNQSAVQVPRSTSRSDDGQRIERLIGPDAPGTPVAERERAIGIAEHEPQMEAEREKMEIRMVEEQEAQERRMNESVKHHDADTATYLESPGMTLPR